MNTYFLTILSLLFFCSCNYLTQDASIIPIARVNDSYLYNEDIIDLISENTTKDDSTLIVNNFINRWATKQLLIDQSMINLSQEKQDFFNEMVSQYKTDLYTEAYKSSIISKQLDTVILKKGEWLEVGKVNWKKNTCSLVEATSVNPNVYEDIDLDLVESWEDVSEVDTWNKSFNYGGYNG